MIRDVKRIKVLLDYNKERRVFVEKYLSYLTLTDHQTIVNKLIDKETDVILEIDTDIQKLEIELAQLGDNNE